LCLECCSVPEVCTSPFDFGVSDRYLSTFYVRGTDKNLNYAILSCSNSVYNDIVGTVNIYNHILNHIFVINNINPSNINSALPDKFCNRDWRKIMALLYDGEDITNEMDNNMRRGDLNGFMQYYNSHIIRDYNIK